MSYGIRSGDLRNCSSYRSLPHMKRHFSLTSDRSATRGRYATVNVANGYLISFLSVFKLFYVCNYTRLNKTPVSYHPNHLLKEINSGTSVIIL
jgi:hypothetical protein